ncbi:monomeric sarcosine oxidase-like isoform X2 [Diadema antillarum]|uniref:monomeric sarcosine oxidase-like isoform X2 n=1 Tax=Diadema antillarum TaxID=105358 RepID=UPI003A875B14
MRKRELRCEMEGKATMYDVCVVGAGMVGSAAAKWLSQQADIKVCLIGPQEPEGEEWNSADREIFGCHYDEGRITRELDHDSVWATLARRSIQRYKDIERESGLKFYEEVGCAFIDRKGSPSNLAYRRTAERLGIQHKILNATEFHATFPHIHVEDNTETVWTPRHAGHISPRTLVRAQQRLAERRGCDIIREVAVNVEEVNRGGGNGGGGEFVKVTTKVGRTVLARRVLLCCGASTNYYNLLPRDKKLDFKSLRGIVILAELSKDDVDKLRGMPSLGYHDNYALPPIKYPDGRFYLKLGFRADPADEVHTVAEAASWYKSHGRGRDATEMLEVFRGLFPDLKPVSMETNSCLVTLTPNEHLYCDMASPRVGVLACMNGWGAKSSDEIGRMGALMISKGSWDHDLNADLFKLRFKPASTAPSKY